MASNNQLKALIWARENGCEWNTSFGTYAARNGHFAVLKWARKMALHRMLWYVPVPKRNDILEYTNGQKRIDVWQNHKTILVSFDFSEKRKFHF